MLKHLISLVFLLITLFYLPLYGENNNQLLPKPKPKILFGFVKDDESTILPQKKPYFFNKITTKKKSILPKNKPISKKILLKKETEDKSKSLPQAKSKTELKNLNTNIVKKDVTKSFLFPEKKPVTFKQVVQKEADSSEILSKRDYVIAKEVFVLIKQKKWKSALKATKRVKDKNFKALVTWLHLKETRNTATFEDYVKFIESYGNYPRIGRIKYLAEHKINLANTSPSTIIGWFSSEPPLSGFGQIKLGEAFLKRGEIDKGAKLIKEGWVTASLSSQDLRYLNKKYRKIINSSDHIKRAEYLSWEYKYWDLKEF